MVTLEQIRARLQDAIRQSGLSQIAIARKIRVHHSAIGQYLSGRAMPALDTFANLCEVLDVEPAEILCIGQYRIKNVQVSDSFNNNSGNINFKA